MSLKLLVCVLFALDAATTIYALSRKGFQELNPVLRWLIARMGLVGATVLTHGPLIAIFFFLSMPQWTVWAGCLVGGYAVANNAYVLWKHRAK
jgi:hypothetical protein